jgi:hypothetical protein
MTTIKTTCTLCGAIELTPGDLTLELRPGGREGNYRFNCPRCAEPQRRPANPRMVSVLMATGVTFEVLDAEPITDTEIETFVATLDAESDPFRLIGLTQRSPFAGR